MSERMEQPGWVKKTAVGIMGREPDVKMRKDSYYGSYWRWVFEPDDPELESKIRALKDALIPNYVPVWVRRVDPGRVTVSCLVVDEWWPF